MANKEQVWQSFWSSFGLPAYDESTVPTGENAPGFPYLTYNVIVDSIDRAVYPSVSLWYRSSSWKDVTEKSEEISAYIGLGGKMVAYDGGAVWVKRGAPFAQRMADDTDDMIRRIYLNIEAEFISAN